jgi:uncharacterized protein DUF3179
MRTHLTLILIISISLSSFSQTLNGFDLTNALITPADIKKGGPPRDGIPALNYPSFLKLNEASFLSDSDLVIGLVDGLESKAYPIGILNWHEIINDSINNKPVVITYCPLCGSGMVFNSSVNGKTLTFGVSGLLFNSDVLLYDKQTESLWSQMMAKSINGKQVGRKLEIIHSDLTTWGQWKQNHPNTLVLSTQTGFKRDYTRDPYQGYISTEKTYFPVNATSNKVPGKERVLGVQVKNGFKAYPYSELAKSDGVLKDEFKGVTIEIHFDIESNTAALLSPKDINSVSSYWFAWYAFHPYTKVYNHNR